MNGTERLIVVVDRSAERAAEMKALIEFMDAPAVEAATPRSLTASLIDYGSGGSRRLAAVFIGAGVSGSDRDGLFDAIGKADPNVPIVLFDGVEND